ncbi:putative toxin-antitoxin system toxin component, PIN family [Thermococcus sp. 21S9]|uniref:putative toxin-antitoxin system toxin component, PIN family n=1 Tax=Thermococcus sp. 21S9 TaxID=1638223 RepID=UPI001695A689|nr:putative toxin-antitoxin system toxin component, PIN family [Thermococcus sp. 21S9]NJE54567.1 putative toxin-antitoxin system toxin component, PIN family [Thermococcus sp. 21S9]
MADKIRVVLDTSVLISALKTKNPKRSPAWRVLKALRTGEITNFISKEIAEEMQEKLLVIGDEVGRPNVADYILTLVLNKSIMVRPRRKFSDDPEFLKNLRDPNDAKFFDVAYVKKVDYIISENTKHIVQMRDEATKTYRFDGRKVKILRAGEFVREALR